MTIDFIKGFVKSILLVLLWVVRILCTPFSILLGLLTLIPFLSSALLIYLWDWCNDEEDLEFPFTLAFAFPVFIMLTGTFNYNFIEAWADYCGY